MIVRKISRQAAIAAAMKLLEKVGLTERARIIIPTSSPVGSSNAWRLPVHWPCSLG